MIKLEPIRELRTATAEGGRGYIGAASGLVIDGNRAIVVGDDSLSLATFSITSSELGIRVPLFSGVLPNDPNERKRRKPDLEALFALTDPRGTLLVAVPSGSKPNRILGAVADLNGSGPRSLDFTGLFQGLHSRIPALNIEGVVETPEFILLFHRGNSAGAENAVIRVDHATFLSEVREGKITARGIREISRIPLGDIDGIRLTFGDAACDRGGRVWFLASAEATEDAYLDGEYGGAILGCLGKGHDRVEVSYRIDCPAKPEGLGFAPGDDRTFYVVTDADHPEAVSGLFRGRLD